MKLAYVLKQYPKLSETFILNEMLELERQGVELTIFALEPSTDSRFHAGVARLRAPIVYLRQGKPAHWFEYLRGRAARAERLTPSLSRAVSRALAFDDYEEWKLEQPALMLALEMEERGIEHMHAHFAGPAAMLARLAHIATGTSYSFTCHAKDIYHDSVPADRVARLTEDASRVVTVCDANLAHLREQVGPRLSERVTRLYNGIDLGFFHPRLRKPSMPPLVLGVGRLVAKKGFADLVRAAAHLEKQGQDFRCLIVGEGRERAQLEALIVELGSTRVQLAGALSQEEVREHLAKACVVALPCIVAADGNRDALPTTLLEALAMGTPIVSTPVVGVQEIVNWGAAGDLVPERDFEALATAIARLFNDPALHESRALAGRERAEDCFDLRKNVGTLREIFMSAVAREATAS